MKKLFFKLLLAASFLTPLFINKVQAMGSGPYVEGLKDFAKSVSLGIETPASSGSGVLIGKKGDTYFFLTADHVAISDPQEEEFWAYSVAGGQTKQYRITSFEKPNAFEGKDIVIGSFTTKDQLRIALIFPLDIEKYVPRPPSVPFYTWQVINMMGASYDDEWDIQGPPLIGGVSIPTRAITVPIFRFSSGVMQTRALGNQKGYEAIYSAISTVPGMSGGGIYGARSCARGKFDPDSNKDWWGAYPGVIGLHGMSEEYGSSGGRSGTSLGVPLDLFVEYLGKNADRYGIPIGKDYYDEVIKLCVTQGMY